MDTKAALPPFIEFLNERLNGELPGIDAHIKMAPMIGDEPFRPFKPTGNARKSAVIAILTDGSGSDFDILLTLRSSDLKSHRGQISFPGGMNEEGETSVEAALREAWEEVGITSSDIFIAGSLSELYVPPANSVISPIVGYIPSVGELTINPSEVEEVFFIGINELAEGKNKRTEPWNFGQMTADVPFWQVHRKTPLWGATAMILMELLELYKEFQELNPDLLK
jgi:8-oxo-dGTP pyrophosphatase MutT (NUDIX family)